MALNFFSALWQLWLAGLPTKYLPDSPYYTILEKKEKNRYLRLSSQKWQLSSKSSKIIYWREMYSLVTTKSIESCFNLVESELWSDFGQSLVKLFILILTSQLAEQFKSDHETFLICILRRAFQYTYVWEENWMINTYRIKFIH